MVVSDHCPHHNTKVTQSRRSPDGARFAVYRERRCKDCNSILFTREIMDGMVKLDLLRIHSDLYEGKSRHKIHAT